MLLQVVAPSPAQAADQGPACHPRAGRERGRDRHRRRRRLRLQDGEPQPSLVHRALSGRGDRGRRHFARRLHHGRKAGRGAQLPALRRARSSQDAAPRGRGRRPGSAAMAIRSACRRSAARPASISGYDGNILVNALAVGVARRDAIFTSAATGVGNPIVYLGSKTGRDGIHGASMASAAFEADAEEKRPTVQVGDPFAEKLLLEACLELMASGAVIAIQDMGAAGLTSSAAEMGAKGDLGIELDLDRVPCRETGMTRLRDDALREPGAHADGAQAREGARGRGDLPQMGARFRRHRQDHRHAPLRRQARRRGQGGPADQGARRPGAPL